MPARFIVGLLEERRERVEEVASFVDGAHRPDRAADGLAVLTLDSHRASEARAGCGGSAAPIVAAVRLGHVANADAAGWGKPLDGVRVLAVEQMQALPYATQLLARLGANVVKVEHPVNGESGRHSTPAMLDPDGRKVGATYLRNNFNKRSVGIDLKLPAGRELFL